MKKIVSTLLVAVLFCATAALAAPATLTGTLTDSMCAKAGKHMMPGKSDAECTRECVKAGAKWALLSDGKVYLLDGDKAKFNDLAGKRVTLTGEVSGSNVVVKQIAAAK
jgi:hypothetical protein